MNRNGRWALLAGLLFATVCLQAGAAEAHGYVPKSAYLKEPRKNLARIVELADFFLPAKDTENGGFYSSVDRAGVPNEAYKGVAPLARVSYLYSRAFMVTGRQEYLSHARHALDFMYEHGWDEEHGGWWFSLDAQGELSSLNQWWDPNTWKWTYQQIYPLVGVTAFVEATGSDFDKSWLNLGLDVLNTKIWDGRVGLQGYYTDADLDWSNPRGKGFTPNVDGLTTHALAAYLVTGDPELKARLLALADGIVDHLIPSMDDPEVLFGFPEQFDANWVFDRTNYACSVGHVLKAAWVLQRAYLISPKPSYRAGAQRLIDEVLDNGGYDFANGAPFSTCEWNTGVVNHDKGYFEVEQAVMAGLLNHALARDHEQRSASLRMADESLQFFHDHFWDSDYGGHYFATDELGNVTDERKSDAFEQGYHASELLYFAYVYGNLYLKRSPISLYYAFEASDTHRSLQLNPVELTSRALKIHSVKRAGRPYPRFDAASRTLRIPPGVGGTFQVTFSVD